MAAFLECIADRTFGGTTVRLVAARAGVSTATFYRHFDGLEGCLIAVLDLGVGYARELVTRAFEKQRRWQDGVREALASVLLFLDSEPLLTRAWFIDSLAAGQWALERRERNTRLVESMIVEPWAASDGSGVEAAAMAGVMASVFGMIHSHLIRRQPGPLIELLAPMMGLIVGPFLDSEDTAEEVKRAVALTGAIRSGEDPRWVKAATSRSAWRLHRRPCPAPIPGAGRRAHECLLFLAQHPGASNRELAVGIGIKHKSQTSKLLADLRSRGLAVKHSLGAGRRNAWHLTPAGDAIARALTDERRSASQTEMRHPKAVNS